MKASKTVSHSHVQINAVVSPDSDRLFELDAQAIRLDSLAGALEDRLMAMGASDTVESAQALILSLVETARRHRRDVRALAEAADVRRIASR